MNHTIYSLLYWDFGRHSSTMKHIDKRGEFCMREIRLAEPFLFEKSKKAVLLLHAYTGSANDVRPLGRYLERNGYTVYAPQFAGHATKKFEDVIEKGGPDIWLQDVVDATTFLKEKGYEQIAVLGLSLGGIMATRAIELYDYIAGGSFNSPIYDIGESRVPAAFLNYFRSFKKRQGYDLKIIEQEREAIKPKLNKQLDELTKFSEQIQKDIEKIDIPYYIASSGKDELISPSNGKVLRDALINAKVDYNRFPDSTHVITIGSKRDPFEKSVLTFLNNLNWKEG